MHIPGDASLFMHPRACAIKDASKQKKCPGGATLRHEVSQSEQVIEFVFGSQCGCLLTCRNHLD